MAPHRILLALGLAALLALGVCSSAFAQPLPMPAENDPVARMMLAGEAAAVADFLEITPDQLRSELEGQSLALVAQQHGKSAADVTRVVVDTANAELDTAVSNGELSGSKAALYRFQIGLYAPTLVQSTEASALALAAATA